MPHEYDGSGADMNNDSFVIPDDTYTLQIVRVKEGESKKGDYQVTVDLKVVGSDYDGFDIKFHRVTFLKASEHPKAAGMSLHWLHVIGQPYEGKFQIDPENWEGKKLKAYLEQSEYNGFKSMKIKWVDFVEQEESKKEEPVEEVPF